jgi:hypothetical protein
MRLFGKKKEDIMTPRGLAKLIARKSGVKPVGGIETSHLETPVEKEKVSEEKIEEPITEKEEKTPEVVEAKPVEEKPAEVVGAQPTEIAQPAEIIKEEEAPIKKEEVEEDEFEKAKRRIREQIEKTAKEESRKLDEKHGFAPKEAEKPEEEKKEEIKPIEKIKEVKPEEKKETLQQYETKLKEAIKAGDIEKMKAIQNEIDEKFIKKEKAPEPAKKPVPEPAKEPTPEPAIRPEEKGLQTKLDDARNKYAGEYKKFMAERKKGAGIFKKIFGGKVPEKEIPEELKKLEKEYDQMAVEFGKKMYAEKQAELKKSGKTEEEQKAELARYKANEIFTKIIVEEQGRLNALKAENLPPKEKGILRKSLDWYLKQPRWKKIAISTALSTAIIGTFSSGAIAAAGGIAAYAGVKYARGLAGSIIGQSAAKAYDLFFKEKSAKKRELQEKELQKLFTEESFDTSLAKNKKEYAEILEREKRAKRQRLITKAAITLAAGGLTSFGVGYGLHHISPEEVLAGKAHVPMTGGGPEIPKAEAEATGFPPHGPGYTEAVEKGFQHPPEEVIEKGLPPETAPEIHGVQYDVKFILGKEGVPASLERTFHSIAADHMELGAGEVANEEFGAKSLNMAANLVKLAEGHNVAGISTAEFEQVAHFDPATQTLEIKDHAGFNNLVGKLEDHAKELWDKGAMEGAKASLGNIKDETFLKIVHAEGMDKGIDLETGQSIDTGIIGHDDVSSVEIFHEGVEIHGVGVGGTEIPEAVNEAGIPQEAPTGVGVGQPPELEHISARMPPGYGQAVETPPAVLSPEVLEQVNQTYKSNINHIFGDNMSLWDNLKDSHLENLTADKVINLRIEGLNEDTKELVSYLQKIREVTGLNPIEKTLVNPAETNTEYITRGLQKAAEMGKLDELKL